MKIELIEWYNKNQPEDKMFWKNEFKEQINFIHNQIPNIFAENYEEFKEIRNSLYVVSEHSSKSINLPVVEVTPRYGLTLRMRNNFYDWVVSVESQSIIVQDFMGLFDPEDEVSHHCCEGFKPDWIFGSYKNDYSKFTVSLNDNYKLYTFLWILSA